MTASLPAPYWTDGKRTIYHGDCRELLPLLPKVDLVLTDPPYGIDGRSKIQMRGGQVVQTDYVNDSDLPLWWFSLAKMDAAIVFTDNARITLVRDGLEAVGLSPKAILCWDKGDGGINPRGNFVNAFETAVYSRSPDAKWHGNGSTINLFRYQRCRSIFHPTEKPTAVIKYFMAPTSSVDSTILDPFMGSGTTLVAARDMGRSCIGIEIEEPYCEIAAKRLSQGVLFE